MTGAVAENRFAPPRADVEDQADDAGAMVDASRGARLLAVIIDSVLPLILIGVILAGMAIPAYENYRQAHAPGIEPPRLSSHHLTTAWAWLGGMAVIAFHVWSTVLVWLYGQTVGKRLMDIRVVRTDGARVTFARFVPLFNVVIGLLDPLLIFRDSRQCLHDSIADTKVVTAASSVDATLNGDAKYARTGLRTITF
jgi:uncharacterized RDD family membrane protein YckC